MDIEASGSTYNPVHNLSKAVHEVQTGSELSTTAAKYKIPASILHNRVIAIRHLKEKKLHQDIQTAVNASTQEPDKFGLIINEKFFKCKKLANAKGVYVDQNYYDALHFIFNGGLRNEAILKYKLNEKLLKRKIRAAKFFVKKSSSSVEMDEIENQFTKVMAGKIPKLTKYYTIFSVIKYLVEAFSLSFPEEFLVAISRIEQGADFKEIVETFSFNLTPFIRVVRCMRFLKGRTIAKKKSNANFIKSLIPSIHPSFADISLTKTESLAIIEKFYKRKTNEGHLSWNEEDLEKAFRDIKNNVPLISVARKYQIPYSTLRGRAEKRNLNITPKKKRGGRRGTNSSSESPAMLSKEEEVQVMASPATKSLVKGKTKKSQLICLLCHQPGNREEELGKLHIINKVVVHYYCLLFSCALEQNGKDDEGILGFLPKDIMKEISRGSKLKCMHCGLKGATIGCNNKFCKMKYHFPCGLDNFAQFIFTNNFSSMCLKHRKFQNGQGVGQNVECPICMEMMEADPKFAVWAPCCQKSSWFHRKCIQKLALSAGYFFKCPLCNDRNTFTKEMLHQGIFVPDQDASWELEPNAFQELLERPIRCDASICKCPAGRKSDEEGTRWEVLLCYLCGSTGIHIACGKLKATTTEWHCPTCIEMLRESAQRANEENRIRRRNVYKKKRSSAFVNSDNDYSSAEEVDIEALVSPSKRKRSSSSSANDLEQPSSSKGITGKGKDGPENLDSSDEIVSVPKGIRGDIVIKDLLSKGEPLSDALEEMKAYAENFQSKMAAAKMDEKTFLEILNQCASSNVANKCYKIDESHLAIFADCLYNFDQMRLLRKVFELVFFLQSLKLKLSKATREKTHNPFSRKKRRYKDLSLVKESLVNLLVKAKSAKLLDGKNTWSSYGNCKKNAYFNNNKNTEVLPSTSRGTAKSKDEEIEPSNLASYRFIRILDDDNLRETCMWCNMALVPGVQPTTIKLSIGYMEVICTSCLTCNVFNNLFPKLPYPQPVELKPSSNDPKETSTVKQSTVKESESMETDVQMDSDSSTNSPYKKNLRNSGDKNGQSSILSYFSPKSKEKESHPSFSSTSKCAAVEVSSSTPISTSKSDRTTLSSATANSTSENNQVETTEDLRKVKINRQSMGANSSAKNKSLENKRDEEIQMVNSMGDKPLRVFKLEEDKSNPRKVKLVEEKPQLRALRHVHDSSGPRMMKLAEGNSQPRIVELAEEKTKFGVSKVVEAKPAPRIIKLTEDKPQIKIIKPSASAIEPKVIQFQTLHPNLQLNKNSNPSKPESDDNGTNNASKNANTPPSHPSMSISFSNKNKMCKTCESIEEKESNRKISVIYCPCCSDVPTFCTQKHFDQWHSFTHNWVIIPPSKGIARPFKKCRVCPQQNFTRYYCPACPGDIGYCSIDHYNIKHPNHLYKPKPSTSNVEIGETSLQKSETEVSSGSQYPIVMKPDLPTNQSSSKDSLKSFRIQHGDTKGKNSTPDINTSTSKSDNKNSVSKRNRDSTAETLGSTLPKVNLSSEEGLTARLTGKKTNTLKK